MIINTASINSSSSTVPQSATNATASIISINNGLQASASSGSLQRIGNDTKATGSQVPGNKENSKKLQYLTSLPDQIQSGSAVLGSRASSGGATINSSKPGLMQHHAT